jgi:hypothetical protein
MLANGLGYPLIVLVSFVAGYLTRNRWSSRFAHIIESAWVILSAVSLCVGAEIFTISSTSESERQLDRSVRHSIIDYKTLIKEELDDGDCAPSSPGRLIYLEGGETDLNICAYWENAKNLMDTSLQRPPNLTGFPFAGPNDHQCFERKMIGDLSNLPPDTERQVRERMAANWKDFCTTRASIQAEFSRPQSGFLIRHFATIVPYWFAVFATVAGLRCAKTFIK